MNKLIPILFLFVFASCGEKSNSESSEFVNILEDITFTVDTVVVDPGDEIINLSMGLYLSDISTDKKWLYQFDSENTTINAIDLNTLSLDHQLEFEKEGPDGVGTYVFSLQSLPNEQFMIAPFRSAGIFNNQGKKIEDVTPNPGQYSGIEEKDEVELSYLLTSSKDQKYLFSLPGDFLVSGRDLLKMNKETKTAKFIDIPELDLTEKFTLINRQGEYAEISMEEYFLEEIDKYLYISSSVTSDLYRYHLENDSLSFYSFPLKTTPKAKTEFPKTDVNSTQEYKEQKSIISSQITYSGLLWDEERKLFFRIGKIVMPSDIPDGKPTIEIYIIAFNTQMQLVGESKIDGLEDIIEYAFFKDGKLWSYVNVEDELGFAVFTFDF
ncbi:DUF4221 family protein [Algoriphagus aestuarii]|nr:DUF4221 family protein [Algoriphagus aestuarii]